MNRLTVKGKGKWPVAFQDKQFTNELKEFETAVDEALDKATRGKSTVEEDHASSECGGCTRDQAGTGHRSQNRSTSQQRSRAALKDLRNTAQQFETQGVQQALGEIAKYPGTTVNDLKIFMRKYNLTFGRAETPEERKLYPELYKALQIQREKFAGVFKSSKTE